MNEDAKKKRYTSIENDFILNQKMSGDARFLGIVMASVNSGTFNYNKEGLMTITGYGRDRLSKALKELTQEKIVSFSKQNHVPKGDASKDGGKFTHKKWKINDKNIIHKGNLIDVDDRQRMTANGGPQTVNNDNKILNHTSLTNTSLSDIDIKGETDFTMYYYQQIDVCGLDYFKKVGPSLNGYQYPSSNEWIDFINEHFDGSIDFAYEEYDRLCDIEWMSNGKPIRNWKYYLKRMMERAEHVDEVKPIDEDTPKEKSDASINNASTIAETTPHNDVDVSTHNDTPLQDDAGTPAESKKQWTTYQVKKIASEYDTKSILDFQCYADMSLLVSNTTEKECENIIQKWVEKYYKDNHIT